MAVILHRFSTEISSSGLGRRPLTAETRVRVPVSLPAKPSPDHERGLYLSTEISSSGLGRRPLTAETRVRVPVSLPNEAFSQLRLRAFVLFVLVLAIVASRLPVPRLSRGPVSCFLAEVQQPLARSRRGPEDIAFAAVLQAQALSQLLSCHREVTRGDIGSGDTFEGMSQFLLVHRCDGDNGETAARKFLNLLA